MIFHSEAARVQQDAHEQTPPLQLWLYSVRIKIIRTYFRKGTLFNIPPPVLTAENDPLCKDMCI